MKTGKASALFHAQNILGEGPLWHPLEQRLYWVDIQTHVLFQSNHELTNFRSYHFDTPIGCFGFRKDGGLILGTGKGFAFWKPGQEKPEYLWNPLPAREGVRMNDGKVDPAGRFWAGSMDVEKRQGELYRLDPDLSRHTLLNGIGISNGLGWSPDCKTMYYTDTPKFAIFSFDYDMPTGNISNGNSFIKLPQDHREVVPDGLCVDQEGYLWGAHWNGWEVVRYDPQGNPTFRIEVPAQRVTSCYFGGKDLDQLFITTARAGLTDEALIKQPAAGDVFLFHTKTRGLPTNLFG